MWPAPLQSLNIPSAAITTSQIKLGGISMMQPALKTLDFLSRKKDPSFHQLNPGMCTKQLEKTI
jgi:hypothetical protein